MDKPQCFPAPGWGRDLEDSFMSSGEQKDIPQHQTPTLHPAAQKASPGAGGLRAAHCS